jgi:glycerate 2-kinase
MIVEICANRVLGAVYSAIQVASPEQMVRSFFKKNSLDILQHEQILVFALGKASLAMSRGLLDVVPEQKIKAGLIVTHIAPPSSTDYGKIEIVNAPHPIPNNKSLLAGRKAQRFFSNTSPRDHMVCLISGGGSSMLVVPKSGISFTEKLNVIREIMTLGIPEREVNEIRKAMSAVKQGRLLQEFKGMKLSNVFLSDEREHRLDAISSGPTTTGHSLSAKAVMDAFRLDKIIGKRLRSSIEQTDNHLNKLKFDLENHICGDRSDVLSALHKSLEKLGCFRSIKILTDPIHSMPPQTALEYFKRLFTQNYSLERGWHAFVVPTEIQVPVKPNSKGGRNQHLIALAQAELKWDFRYLLIGFATDGVDFIDGVHGAFFESWNVIDEKKTKELEQAIQNTNSYFWHRKNGTLIEGSKTGHNVSDLLIMAYEVL